MPPPAFDALPRPLRVFVVENHPDTLKYLRLYLETLGHEVSAAPTMHGALAALLTAPPDVLISDIGLPDGTGWELMQRLDGRLGPDVYTIAMSGFALHADQARPFSPDHLGDLLDEAARELAAGVAARES